MQYHISLTIRMMMIMMIMPSSVLMQYYTSPDDFKLWCITPKCTLKTLDSSFEGYSKTLGLSILLGCWHSVVICVFGDELTSRKTSSESQAFSNGKKEVGSVQIFVIKYL